jgi:hypothetical protein
MRNISTSILKENPNNPRKIEKDKLDKLVKSIQEFPEMLEKRPLVVDENFVLIGGNMRLRALKILGIQEVPVIIAEGWSDEQKRQFLIKDNVNFGDWDMDILNQDFDLGELSDWGLDFPSTLANETKSVLLDLTEEKQELVPYKKVHVLLSFSPEALPLIAEYLEKIRKTEGIEYEQGAN